MISIPFPPRKASIILNNQHNIYNKVRGQSDLAYTFSATPFGAFFLKTSTTGLYIYKSALGIKKNTR